MNQIALYSVITTIQAPTPAMVKLGQALRRVQGHLLVVGDKKGPAAYPVRNAELLSLPQQLQLPLAMPAKLPLNHYSRKNLGYLVAISRGAKVIYETDDDNQPSSAWKLRQINPRARKVSGPEWCNVYQYFTNDFLWPRGFPLDSVGQLSRAKPRKASRIATVHSPIQQGLVALHPDVDAVWRLVVQGPAKFKNAPSVALAPRVWCPFNTQSTWWWPEAYPLLYLPSFCTFRMTDIWRSFIAQRCLWELGGVVSFHAPEVVQRRNVHDLMRDFADEVPGYLSNRRICRLLSDTRLQAGPDALRQNLFRCYEALIADGLLPKDELTLLRAWFEDLDKVTTGLVL